MAKVNLKSEKITPFGGIYYASKAFYALPFIYLCQQLQLIAGITQAHLQKDEQQQKRSNVRPTASNIADSISASATA